MNADELPTSITAPAWLLSDGVVLDALTARASVQIEPTYAQRHTPWAPLDTAEEWVQRIDRDQLAKVIAERLDIIFPEDCHNAADAVLAALPELMGGEEA